MKTLREQLNKQDTAMTQIDKKAFKIAKNVLLNCKTLCCYNEEALLSALESYEAARAPRTISKNEIEAIAKKCAYNANSHNDSSLFYETELIAENASYTAICEALETLNIQVEP